MRADHGRIALHQRVGGFAAPGPPEREFAEDDEGRGLRLAIVAEEVFIEGLRQDEGAARDLRRVLGKVEGLREISVHAPKLHVVEKRRPGWTEPVAEIEADARNLGVML